MTVDARDRFDRYLAEMRATTSECGITLNRLAFMAFQYVGAGQLDEAEVEQEFIAAGLAAGLEEEEARITVNSAKAGIAKPSGES